MPRLFVALPIAPDVVAALAEAARTVPAGWRTVRPEAMHLTLAFIGEVPSERLEAAKRALRRGTEGHTALDLEAAGLGAFPDQQRPRVLWAGVGGDLRGLARLQADVAGALREEGFELDGKPFRPHLTLARARDPRPLPVGLDRAGWFGAWRAAEVTLYESRLGPAGPRDEALLSRALPPAVA